MAQATRHSIVLKVQSMPSSAESTALRKFVRFAAK
jgi:hypothetical protein